jgi:hypothetical protein
MAAMLDAQERFWAKGEQHEPGKPRPATTPPPPQTPQELLTRSAQREPTSSSPFGNAYYGYESAALS